MDDFLIRALLAGIGVALVAGPLGSFVVWRRMAYFGDTLAHAALLGIALGFLLGINTNLSIIIVCMAMALILVTLQHHHRLASDTLLGILSHSALSIGLIAIASMESLRVNLVGYLFGDILAVSNTDLIWIYVSGGASLLILIGIWHSLVALTVHEELAEVEGVPVVRTRFIFLMLMAMVIAIAMKVVGILLITSLLIIPAATARFFARTPEQMAILAAIIGCIAVVGGLFGSFTWDTPTGPSVVVAAALLFILGTAWPQQNTGSTP